jgi:hypothetical protein
MLKEAIFAVLLAQPVSKYDATEPIGARHERLGVVAQAIADASRGDRTVAAAVTVQAIRESGLRRDVQVCECRPGHCDTDPDTKDARAHGLWQFWDRPTWSTADWWSICGVSLESVARGAQLTAAYFRGRTLEEGFALQGGITGRIPQFAVARAKAARRLAGRL